MTSFVPVTSVVAVLALAFGIARGAGGDPEASGPGDELPTASLPAADELIATLLDRQRSEGFRLRASVRYDDDTVPEGERSAQLLAKGRRTQERSQFLIVGMWPDELRGQAVMIERGAEGALGGFHFMPPDSVRPLREGDLGEPLFGTRLTAEDLVASFWRWPSQRTVERSTVDERECWVVESRPAPDEFPLVRTCVGVREGVPLEIDRYDAEGRRYAHVTVDRLVQRGDGEWVPAAFSILALPEGRYTRVRFSRADRDVAWPAEDFTVAGVRALVGEN